MFKRTTGMIPVRRRPEIPFHIGELYAEVPMIEIIDGSERCRAVAVLKAAVGDEVLGLSRGRAKQKAHEARSNVFHKAKDGLSLQRCGQGK